VEFNEEKLAGRNEEGTNGGNGFEISILSVDKAEVKLGTGSEKGLVVLVLLEGASAGS
jgi:hypothetical protein